MYVTLTSCGIPSEAQPSTADDETQKSIMRNDPQKYLAYRKKIESELNSRFRFILNGSPEQAEARKVTTPVDILIYMINRLTI